MITSSRILRRFAAFVLACVLPLGMAQAQTVRVVNLDDVVHRVIAQVSQEQMEVTIAPNQFHDFQGYPIRMRVDGNGSDYLIQADPGDVLAIWQGGKLAVQIAGRSPRGNFR